MAGQGAIHIWLSGEPRGKGRPRFTRQGHAYTPSATRNYEAALRLAAQGAMSGRAILEGPVRVAITAFMPIPTSWSNKKKLDAIAGLVRPTTKPDADNLAKMVDAFNEIVWRDDKQAVDVSIAKFYAEIPGFQAVVEAI